MGSEGGDKFLGAIGSIFQGFSQNNQASQQASAIESYGAMQAQAYEANARLAEMDAVAARDAAAANALQQGKVNRARIGSVKSAALGNGFALEGTPILILEEEARQGELQRLNEIYKGDISATKFSNEAKVQRFYGAQAVASASIKADGIRSRAGSSLLSGISDSLSNLGGE